MNELIIYFESPKKLKRRFASSLNGIIRSGSKGMISARIYQGTPRD